MRIEIGSLIRGAQEAKGIVVIIDVFRAFTTASVAFQRGADKIVLVAEVAEALELRSRGLGDYCMGETSGIRPEDFEFGNSPFELSRADVKGKTLIQSTRAGTVGVAAARNADQVYAGSLVNAGATVKSILRQSPALVSIVAMGAEGKERADEDEQCALLMRNLLQGRRPDYRSVRSLVLAGAEAQKYGDPARPHFHPQDRQMALQIDATPFAIKVSREDGLLAARPEFV
jgi:2-phosphosulfolactate phosphatase